MEETMTGILRLASKLSAVLTLTLLMGLPVLARQLEQSVFSPVPAESRGRLVERLKLMLEYASNDKQAAVYDMLFGPVPEKMSKEEYIYRSASASSKVANFTSRFVDQKELEKVKGANWRIVGDVKIKKVDGREEVKKGTVYAQLRDGEWYFSGVITTEIMYKGGKPVRRTFKIEGNN
jgi:hypothetical protein